MNGRLTLASGVEMPLVGLGTWPLTGDEARAAVHHALAAGYRLIDTSEQYANERDVGRAVRDSGVPREDIFLSTKFNARWQGRDLVARACDNALRRLGTDHLDLFLIHWPNPWLDRYVDAWHGLIALRDEGRVRAIGVSNFLPAHIDRLIAETGVPPEVNQVELDPTLPREELRAYHAARGIATEAWGPLGRDGRLLRHPIVVELAERHRRTPAQIILRWHVELGLAFTARSSDPARIAQNIELFDFALSRDDLAVMGRLDEGRPPARDPESHGH
ncbi:aldo/keto reductase [Capillimicrobium parvum]|uniref:Oxidoreductase n=1 Tax=Capillimicrobium parvum TaxID=2884022 RepID=A0A9E6XWC6_9ACTN|nr:aldo/keto reductase [Capillimicrobium parvum]UGS35318.1 putative oxidoreductase [Capillimicrobium parvum]